MEIRKTRREGWLVLGWLSIRRNREDGRARLYTDEQAAGSICRCLGLGRHPVFLGAILERTEPKRNPPVALMRFC